MGRQLASYGHLSKEPRERAVHPGWGCEFASDRCILAWRRAREHSAGRSGREAPAWKNDASACASVRPSTRSDAPGGIMTRITRRRLLKLSASSAVAAQTGGLAAVVATVRVPAFAQGTTVHWLRLAYF